MSDLAVHARGLSKRYQIGQRFTTYRTLRDTIMDVASRPFRGGNGSGDELDDPTGEVLLKYGKGHIWALRDVSFDVPAGEIVGFIGQNGVGKSTLLKLLARITEPTEGYAEIRGRVGALLEVGTGFHPELTGRENIFLNGAILGMACREIGRKFDEIVEFSEIEKFIDTPVKYYSSGMYVRLAFAVAAHLEPEVLIIDEVLAVGDVAFQKKCLGKMGGVASEGRTVLFVSHNMQAVSNLCRHVHWLEGGRIIQSGDAETMVAAYIAKSGGSVPGDGFADVRTRERQLKQDRDSARFTWVRTADEDGQQTGSFLEGRPITVEFGFQLGREVSELQVGCGVATAEVYGHLFTLPSPEYEGRFEPGSYRASVRIDPNYLRRGAYAITLHLFADGQRQDPVREAVQFSIEGLLSVDDSIVWRRKWVVGRFRFEQYEWEPVSPTTSGIPEPLPEVTP